MCQPDSETSATTQHGVNPSSFHLISSMAPRLILEELIAEFSAETGMSVQLSAMGGVDAKQAIINGRRFSMVVLARNSIEQLVNSGHVNRDFIDLAVSEVAVAVKSGQPTPDLSSELAVKKAVLAAKSISFSTGPSGLALGALFEQWGITLKLKDRLIIPPPGTPVGSLIAQGRAALGFQQHSELIHETGIDVVGTLPAEIQINTTFSAAVCRETNRLSDAEKLLEFLSAPQADSAKLRHGMRPA